MNRVQRYLPFLVVLVVGCTYASALKTAFVFDDEYYILAEPGIRDLQGFVDLARRTTRPVVYLTFLANYQTGGVNSWDYKATNILIHLLAVLALYGCVRRTLCLRRYSRAWEPSAAWVAASVALLWGLHPLTTQSVTYVWQRCESLMGLFLFATLYSYARYAAGGRLWPWGICSVAFCALGMASKEVMVCAPLLVLLYDWVFVGPGLRDAWRARRAVLLGVALCWLILALLLLNAGAAYHENPGVGFNSPLATWYAYAGTEAGVLVRYLRLCFYPSPLILDYGWPLVHDWHEVVWPGLVILLLLMLSAVGLVKRMALGFLGACFFLVLVPTSSIMPMPDPAVEHRMYVPLAMVVTAAVCLLWSGVRALVVHETRQRALGLTVISVCAIVLGWGTRKRNGVYASERLLWADTVRKVPHNTRAHTNLARACIRRDGPGDRALAREQALKALSLCPTNYDALINLGAVEAMDGHYEQALQRFQEALALDPPFPADALFGMGTVYLDWKRFAKAEATLRRVVALQPRHDEAMNSLGVLFVEQGQRDKARQWFRAALRANPNNRAAKSNLDALDRRENKAGALP